MVYSKMMVALLLLSVQSQVSTEFINDINFAGEAKCELTWELTTKDDWQSNAIIAASDKDGKQVFYSILELKEFKEEPVIGIIKDTSQGVATFYKELGKKETLYYFKDNCLDNDRGNVESGKKCEFSSKHGLKVLSNPNRCKVFWSTMKISDNNKKVGRIDESNFTKGKARHVPCLSSTCFMKTTQKDPKKGVVPSIWKLEKGNTSFEKIANANYPFYGLDDNFDPELVIKVELMVLEAETRSDPSYPNQFSRPDNPNNREKNNLGERDCCPLVWKPLIKTVSNTYVPKDAILAGNTKDGDGIFYSRMSLKDWHYGNVIGFVLATETRKAYFVKPSSFEKFIKKRKFYYFHDEEDCFTKEENINNKTCEFPLKKGSDIHVLANPYDCEIGWWFRGIRGQMPGNTRERQFPKFGGYYFARSKYVEDVEIDATHPGILEDNGDLIFPGNKPGAFLSFGQDYNYVASSGTGIGTEALFIDCRNSLEKMYQAELYSINYHQPDLQKLALHKEVVVHSTTMVNTSNETVVTNWSLSNTRSHTFQWNEKGRSTNSFMNVVGKSYAIGGGIDFDTNPRLRPGTSSPGVAENTASEDAYKFKFNLVGLKTQSDKFEDVEENFSKTGKMSLSSSSETHLLNQKIAQPAYSKTTISMTYKPFKGTVKFTSGYRMKILDPQEIKKSAITPKSIESCLKRLDMLDGVHNVRTDENYFYWEMKGILEVDTGTQTDIRVTSVPFEHGQTPSWRSSDDFRQTKYFSYSLGPATK